MVQHGLVVYGCLNGSERLLGSIRKQHGLVVYGCLNGSERLLGQPYIRAAWPSGIWMPKWK